MQSMWSASLNKISAGPLVHYNLPSPLTFWPPNRKTYQFIFVLRCTSDKSLVKIHQQILKIPWQQPLKHRLIHRSTDRTTYSLWCTDWYTEARTEQHSASDAQTDTQKHGQNNIQPLMHRLIHRSTHRTTFSLRCLLCMLQKRSGSLFSAAIPISWITAVLAVVQSDF